MKCILFLENLPEFSIDCPHYRTFFVFVNDSFKINSPFLSLSPEFSLCPSQCSLIRVLDSLTMVVFVMVILSPNVKHEKCQDCVEGCFMINMICCLWRGKHIIRCLDNENFILKLSLKIQKCKKYFKQSSMECFCLSHTSHTPVPVNLKVQAQNKYPWNSQGWQNLIHWPTALIGPALVSTKVWISMRQSMAVMLVPNIKEQMTSVLLPTALAYKHKHKQFPLWTNGDHVHHRW